MLIVGHIMCSRVCFHAHISCVRVHARAQESERERERKRERERLRERESVSMCIRSFAKVSPQQ